MPRKQKNLRQIYPYCYEIIVNDLYTLKRFTNMNYRDQLGVSIKFCKFIKAITKFNENVQQKHLWAVERKPLTIKTNDNQEEGHIKGKQSINGTNEEKETIRIKVWQSLTSSGCIVEILMNDWIIQSIGSGNNSSIFVNSRVEFSGKAASWSRCVQGIWIACKFSLTESFFFCICS